MIFRTEYRFNRDASFNVTIGNEVFDATDSYSDDDYDIVESHVEVGAGGFMSAVVRVTPGTPRIREHLRYERDHWRLSLRDDAGVVYASTVYQPGTMPIALPVS